MLPPHRRIRDRRDAFKGRLEAITSSHDTRTGLPLNGCDAEHGHRALVVTSTRVDLSPLRLAPWSVDRDGRLAEVPVA